MRTVRIVHTTAANEAQGMAMLFLIGIVVVIGVGIYTMAHRMFAETTIPYSQVDLSWREPKFDQYEKDRFYGGGGGSASITRGTYDIEVDIRNRSAMRLYSIDYEATLRVCETQTANVDDCPIVDTASGQLSPDLVPGGHGLQKASLHFSKASDYIGYGRVSLTWKGISGVAA